MNAFFGRRLAAGLDARVRRLIRSRDRGSAIVEFVTLVVVVFVPLVYGVAAFSAVQRGIFASTEAARQAGRALGVADRPDLGLATAQQAARMVAEDQGIKPEDVHVTLRAYGEDCAVQAADYAPSFEPGERFVVCVMVTVRIPFVPDFVDANTSTGEFLVDRAKYGS
jgi:Flp pilus assembly protein TadG